MNVNDVMKTAGDYAKSTMNLGYGGPFGAAVVKNGKIISICSNTVLRDHDPTAHAEMNAIREACEYLETHDLSGCELYATGFPCPMCLSAIIWANISKVYVSGTLEQAEAIGFRDDKIYRFLADKSNSDMLEIEMVDNSVAESLYNDYINMQGTIY